MSNYNFSTINSHDFELLVRDLLNAKEESTGSRIIFRTYKEGKDKGIDLLYSTDSNPYEIVGQAKHYLQTGVDKLLSELRVHEAPKVKKLNPERYIFVTSLPLLVGKAEEILNIFKPFIKSTSDIYDQIELNRLIDQYPQVLEAHFKLWFSGTAVLNKLLNYRIEGRSQEFRDKELRRKIRLYVKTPALDAAREVLEKNKFVIITGEPGVGKTTTAELLVFEAIGKGFRLVYIYDDIKEAEVDLNKKDENIIFYYDDFLGHNALEIAKAKGSESSLIRALKRVSFSDNKLFVFTTRTFILNSAYFESEKLRQFNVIAKQSLITLGAYNDEIRLQLLNNHIEESDLSNEFKDVLREKNIQIFIINHLNFSPRSVEFISSYDHVYNMSSDEFRKFIYKNFNSPDEIWRHAYEQQINENDRLLLNTMLSFGDSVCIEDLEDAYNARLDYEVKFNNFTKTLRAFNISFRRLEGGFIINERFSSDHYTFLNHSLVDFLAKYVREDKREVLRIVESSIYIVQLVERLFVLDRVDDTLKLPSTLKLRLLAEPNTFIRLNNKNEDMLTLSMMLYYYLPYIESEQVILQLISSVSDWGIIDEFNENLHYFIEWLKIINKERLVALISSLSINLFSRIILSSHEIEECVELLTLAKEKYNMDLADHSDEIESISERCSTLLERKIDEDIDELLGYSHANDFVDEKESKSLSIKEDLKEFGLDIKANFARYSEYDWFEIGTDNYLREQLEKDD